MKPRISVIIPTYNEAQNLAQLLPYLQEHGGDNLRDIVVVDASESTDNAKAIVKLGRAIYIRAPFTRRSSQLNYGARIACGDIYYFVHADCIPPPSFISDIQREIEKGTDYGSFSFSFQSNHPLLKINSYFTRKEGLFSGGGDQTLFIRKDLFFAVNGFNDKLQIMEDFDLYERCKKAGYRYTIIPHDVKVSARKYEMNPYWRVNIVQFTVMMAYKFGFSQKTQMNIYKRYLNHR